MTIVYRKIYYSFCMQAYMFAYCIYACAVMHYVWIENIFKFKMVLFAKSLMIINRHLLSMSSAQETEKQQQQQQQ